MTPNPFDQASRYTAKMDPPAFLRWLVPRLPDTVVFHGWLDTRTVPFPGEPDRTCDTVANLVEQTVPETWWAMPIEFQASPQGKMFGRLLEYLARLWLELGSASVPEGRYNLVAAVVHLTGVGQTSRDMQLSQTGLRTCLQVAERNLAEEDAAATLAALAAGQWGRWLLPWIPLMRGGATEGIMDEWKQLAQAEPDARRRADYAGLALVFAELTDCHPQWKQALEGWNVKQSVQVLEWQAEAANQAAKQATKQTLAETLLRVLHVRFHGVIPSELEARIRGSEDPTELNRWVDAAVTATSLEEFRQTVNL